jgi:serine/threonine protein kinase
MATRIHRPGDSIQDRYRIEELIGEGGMQEVYQATDLALERIVCIKAPKHPSAKKRFSRSARMSARVTHPNVAKTLDFLPDTNREYLVEEFVRGTDLQQRLDLEFDLLDPHLAAHLIHHVAKGVEASHRAGVIHRDLKPSNIMVSSDPGMREVRVQVR